MVWLTWASESEYFCKDGSYHDFIVHSDKKEIKKHCVKSI